QPLTPHSTSRRAMKGTWQTTDGGGTLAVPLAIGATVLAVMIAGPVAAAVGAVAEALVITIIVFGALAAAGTVLVVWQRSRRPAAPLVTPSPLIHRPVQPLPGPAPPAIGAPREVHLHFHGIAAEDVAEILRREIP